MKDIKYPHEKTVEIKQVLAVENTVLDVLGFENNTSNLVSNPEKKRAEVLRQLPNDLMAENIKQFQKLYEV